MAIIKWSPMSSLVDPMEEMGRWFEDMARMSMGGAHAFVPAMDVYQTATDVVVEAPLPGVDPAKVDVAIENSVLTIRGSMEKKSEVDEKNYYRKEVRSGSFYRSVALPVRVEGDKARASYENGVLKVVVPKAPEAKTKTLKVNVVKK